MYFGIKLAVVLAALALPIQAQTGTPQTQRGTKPTQGKSPATTVKEQESKFLFTIESVEPDQQSLGSWYRVEGLTINGWRFLLKCPPYPPHHHQLTREQSARQTAEHSDIEHFRKTVLEGVRFASAKPLPTEWMTLWKILDEPFAECLIVNWVGNGDVFPIVIISSEFRNWKDGVGYEIETQTKDESLVLACTERKAKGRGCRSLPPNLYRATRSGSQIRLYDADLNVLGDYRIVREHSTE